jgi:hypothetical protein
MAKSLQQVLFVLLLMVSSTASYGSNADRRQLIIKLAAGFCHRIVDRSAPPVPPVMQETLMEPSIASILTAVVLQSLPGACAIRSALIDTRKQRNSGSLTTAGTGSVR